MRALLTVLGVYVNRKHGDGKRVLDYAVGNPEMLALLRASGAKRSLKGLVSHWLGLWEHIYVQIVRTYIKRRAARRMSRLLAG